MKDEESGGMIVSIDKIIVFKCGGSSVNELSEDFFMNIQALIKEGWKPIVVHGGGPAIQELLERLAIEFEFIDGLRKTTDKMMDVVEMVLTGQINPSLTRKFNHFNIAAVGINGSDQNLLQAEPIDYAKYGQVGEVTKVNETLIHDLLDNQIVPIISPVAIDTEGHRYNVNADTAAGAVASALGAEKLIFVTDVAGILHKGQLIERITDKEIERFIHEGIIYGGMIPKVKAAMKGLLGHVNEVMIVNGKQSQLTKDKMLLGTTITLETEVTST